MCRTSPISIDNDNMNQDLKQSKPFVLVTKRYLALMCLIACKSDDIDIIILQYGNSAFSTVYTTEKADKT